MSKSISSLTVLFEDPFWIGIYERESDGSVEVCKITFGAEPQDYEVYDFIIQNFHRLRFSPSVEAESFDKKRVNPKRMQREIQKQLQETSISTKAQQALSLQREQQKLTHKAASREERELEEKRRYELQTEKRKAKHSGH
jgi:hypothetical protein